MDANLIVRPAEEHDFAAVTALLAELDNPALTDETEAAVRGVFLRHIHAPDTASVLIERDGVPIGVLTMHIRERLNRLPKSVRTTEAL